MSYEPTNWKNGDIITADKLNHIEDGIAGGVLMVSGFSYDNEENIVGTADKTWQEIHDALAAGKECLAILHDGDSVTRVRIDRTWSETGTYYIDFYNLNIPCNLPNEYPATIGH